MILIRNLVFILVSVLYLAPSAFSQKKVITGIVKDYNSEERVPFASVYFQNTTVGKLTDSSGSFSFYLDKWPSDTLLITCVGFQPYKLFLPHDKDSFLLEIP
ncbi:MAG: carboxypeptidase-like regulatory domain-containing protein, partial [Bacteroidetes bacterium]|nr:carboxypeptidase-like regulatory domain-containing protein [Bacteroidota bacterium]